MMIDRAIKIVIPVVVVVVVVGVLSGGTGAVRFEIESGQTKCIGEDINSNAMTVGKYDVVNPHDSSQPLPQSHELSVRVTSSYGNNYHNAEKVTSGQFAFMTAEAGDYMACFWAVSHDPPQKLTVDFDWRTGIAAKDWSNVAKKGSVDVMELELKKLYDSVIAIQEEINFLRRREQEMQELNQVTNSRMGWLSFLSLLVCLSVSGLQVWHLKTFFQKKKLI